MQFTPWILNEWYPVPAYIQIVGFYTPPVYDILKFDWQFPVLNRNTLKDLRPP